MAPLLHLPTPMPLLTTAAQLLQTVFSGAARREPRNPRLQAGRDCHKISFSHSFLQGHLLEGTTVRPNRVVWCLLALLGLAWPAQGGEPKLDGTWKLSTITAAADSPIALIQVATVGGELKGALVDSRFKGLEVKSLARKGETLRLVVAQNGQDIVFEFPLAKDAKTLRGSYGDSTLTRAALAPTTEDKVTNAMLINHAVQPMTQATLVTARLAKTKDKDERAKLYQEQQGLFAEVLAKHADSPAAVDAALALAANAGKLTLKADDVRAWVAAAGKAAAPYGKAYEGHVAAQLARSLIAQDGLAPLALEQAVRAERLLDAASNLDRQVAVLTVLETALQKNGKGDEARAIGARLVKLSALQDREYQAKVPPFKGTPFAGRKGTSDRVVVMELFTGAECPPCVAADVAFDVLGKNYKASDLVLIQYHMHIPGPDPLTNAATEARWAYYRGLFGKSPSGTPTALFNGKILPGGGGGMAQAEGKYNQYCQAIDPLLETAAEAKVSARANRVGDKVTIEANVAEVKNPGAKVKLRLLLVEEMVRYIGGNKLRLHHQVVRAFPGGVEGVAVKEAALRHTASIDLNDLRKELNAYLDDYAANKRPFPRPDRPMRFDHLRVIALVQDDATGEILQAAQVEVGGDKEGR
jgi:hypothetical protein